MTLSVRHLEGTFFWSTVLQEPMGLDLIALRRLDYPPRNVHPRDCFP